MWSNPQIQIWSRLLKISLKENVIFCAVTVSFTIETIKSVTAWKYLKTEDTYICIFL